MTGSAGPAGSTGHPDDVRWPELSAVLASLEPVAHRAVTSVYFEGRTFSETAALLSLDELAVSRVIAAVYRPIARHVLGPGEARAD